MGQKIKKWFNVETCIVGAVIFAAIFFAKFPTVYNWLDTPAGYWYPKNTSWYDAWDVNAYVSYIRYGQRNGLLLENTYTTIPHQKEFIYQYYTSLGVLNRFFHLDPFILFHIASIVTSILLILTVYLVTRVFLENMTLRISAFSIAILGGGLGWIRYLQGADVLTAGFTMVNAFERGHDALSTIFILLSLLCIYKYTISRKIKYIIAGILTTVSSISIHPPLILLYLVVASASCLFHEGNKERLKSLIYPVFIFIPVLFYFVLVLYRVLTNIGFSGIGSTFGMSLSRISSFSITVGFGFLFFFIFWALVFVHDSGKKFKFLKLFFLSQLFFCFFPVDFNLYFVKGLHVWGVILAMYGLASFITNKKIQNVILTILVFGSLISRIYIFNSLMHASVDNSFFFLTKPEGEALSFMSTLPAESAVLSLYKIGNYIPAHTDSKVYYGHKFQTPNSVETLRRAQIFYLSLTEEEQRKFLKDNNISYIYYGWEEAGLRKDNKLNPVNPFSYFPILYSNDAAIVYGIGKNTSK